MEDKITKKTVKYPKGYEPDYIEPRDYSAYRYIIGKCKNVKDPLVAICMNPSAASDEKSDRTVNRIIKISRILSKDGWVVLNTYPERATKAKNIESFCDEISQNNLKAIRNYLYNNNVKEVWGAWGNDNGIKALEKGKNQLIEMLNDMGIKIYYWGSLTLNGNPRHPLQRNEKLNFTSDEKHYL